MLINLDYKKINLADDITIEIGQLNSVDYQTLLRFFNARDLTDSKQATEMVMSSELLDFAKELIPKYCKNFIGLQLSENGNTRNATYEDLFNIGALLQYIPLILVNLFSNSTVSSSEAEELKKP